MTNPYDNAGTQSVANCPVCFNNYNKGKFLPLLLPKCGHTLCRLCTVSIQNATYELSCPICRKRNKCEISELPTNIALLELHSKEVKKCTEHNCEYMAYCVDEDLLLCGACILSHISHNCIQFNDPALSKITTKKRYQIRRATEDLAHKKETINKNWEALQMYINKIHEHVEKHSKGITDAETIMISCVQEGKKACLHDLGLINKSRELHEMCLEFKEKVGKIDEEIERLRYILEDLESLKSFRELRAIHMNWDKNTLDTRDFADLSNVNLLLTTLKTLVHPIDYELAIQTRKLFQPNY